MTREIGPGPTDIDPSVLTPPKHESFIMDPDKNYLIYPTEALADSDEVRRALGVKLDGSLRAKVDYGPTGPIGDHSSEETYFIFDRGPDARRSIVVMPGEKTTYRLRPEDRYIVGKVVGVEEGPDGVVPKLDLQTFMGGSIARIGKDAVVRRVGKRLIVDSPAEEYFGLAMNEDGTIVVNDLHSRRGTLLTRPKPKAFDPRT